MREKPWLGSAPELVARHPLELVCGMLQHLPHSSWDSGAFGLLWLCSAISSTHGLCRALNLTAWPQNHSVFRAKGWREKCTGGARMGLHHLSLLGIFLDVCFTREKILLALPFLTLLPWGMPFWSLPLNFPKPRVIPNIHPHLSVLQPLACPFSVAKCLDCLSGSPLGTQTLVLTAPKMHLWAPNLHLENETETPQLVPALGRAFLTHHNHHPTVCRLSCPTFQKNPQVFIYLFLCLCFLSIPNADGDGGPGDGGVGHRTGRCCPASHFLGLSALGVPQNRRSAIPGHPQGHFLTVSPPPAAPLHPSPHPRPFAAARRSLPRAGRSAPSQRHQSLSWNACGSAGLQEIRSQGSLKRYCDGYRPSKSRGS